MKEHWLSHERSSVYARFPAASRCDGSLRSRRPGPAHGTKPASDGFRNAERPSFRSLCGRRLRLASTARGEWPMRHGAVRDGFDPRSFDWSTLASFRQSGHLRAHRNATNDDGDSDPGNSHLEAAYESRITLRV